MHKQIVLTRQWVSDHNYILVRKQGRIKSDPFLKDPDIIDSQGIVYTKITPAILTRQLSSYAQRNRLYSFDLTSINCLNPSNQPDKFEAQAIKLFKAGKAKELSRIETENGVPVFRYAAPLLVRQSCMNCHDRQGYRHGDIAGCISVYLPIAEAERAIQRNNIFLFSTMIGLIASVVFILFLFTRKLVFKPIKELKEFTKRIRADEFELAGETKGDELKEFANFCYFIDSKLKNQHKELERKIADATKDLSVTNQKLLEANRELSHLNKAKTEFFADISHEIRTPLTAIKGAVDILCRKGSCDDPSYLEIIKKNTDYLIKTFIDLLDYSKMEAGRLELDIQEESLVDIVHEAIDSQRPLADSKGIGIRVHIEEPFVLPCDRQRIFQILNNLISNAIKFSPENSEIIIGGRKENQFARIEIRDKGPGIPDQYTKAIFLKFYQLSGTKNLSSLGRGSSGIGLAICKALVEAHGGKIWVEPNIPTGSCFVFTVPLVSQ